ncbi:MAG: hydrogenase maturation protease [Blastocatellia bacterium]
MGKLVRNDHKSDLWREDTGSRTLVIGVGNPLRGDDAAGVLVARRLAALAGLAITAPIAIPIAIPVEIPVEIIEASGEGAALIDCWAGYDRVILIDAVQSTGAAGQPGRVHRFDVVGQPLPSDFFHYSTHAFSVAEAVELARVLGLLPSVMVVIGITGESFAPGSLLSPAVEEAVASVTAEIARVLNRQSADFADLYDLVKG